MSEHNIRVVSLLNGDEYLAMQHMADSDGLSDSAFIRHLIKREAKRRAMERVSAMQDTEQTAEPAQLVRSRFHAERKST